MTPVPWVGRQLDAARVGAWDGLRPDWVPPDSVALTRAAVRAIGIRVDLFLKNIREATVSMEHRIPELLAKAAERDPRLVGKIYEHRIPPTQLRKALLARGMEIPSNLAHMPTPLRSEYRRLITDRIVESLARGKGVFEKVRPTLEEILRGLRWSIANSL